MDQRLDYIEQRRNGYIFINLHMEAMFMIST
ncbi:bacteriophage endolysin domain protein [Clostridium botulinum]|nr:bacteriophage endolysin domain protein [Clostridium botulinum]